MLKKSLITLALCSSVPLIADVYTSDFKSLGSKRSCANFEGQWLGECQDSQGRRWREATNIKSPNCRALRFGRVWLSIGGMTRASGWFTGKKNFTIDESVAASWNTTRDRLDLQIYGGIRYDQSQINKREGQGHLKLTSSGDLEFEFQQTETQSTKVAKITCTYQSI